MLSPPTKSAAVFSGDLRPLHQTVAIFTPASAHPLYYKGPKLAESIRRPLSRIFSSSEIIARTDNHSTKRAWEQTTDQSATMVAPLTSEISILDGNLIVKGAVLLQDVPGNVMLTASTGASSIQGAFLGASSLESKSSHVFPLGVLKDIRFMCCFRFSLWWMTHRMGNSGKDVPMETQFFLCESKLVSSLMPESTFNEDETVYTVFLPLLEGSFRASLQGNVNDQLELCLESGDAAVKGKGGLHSVFLHAGTDPFKVVGEAVQAVEMHLQTFRRREKKEMPDILNWFGWCTWDAFYTDVSADGIRQGVKSLEDGGTPARFIIIDDGWQSIATDHQHQVDEETFKQIPLARRLTNIQENYKFHKDGKRQEDPALGLQHLVTDIKEKHKLKYVYAWHAIIGYWGGINPEAAGMEHYEGKLEYPVHTEGVLNNDPAMKTDTITVHGIGLAHSKKVFQFYNELHSYLAAAGVDGVKVDIQNVLETLGTGSGGRVSLTRHYQQALEDSVGRNFPGNSCIACMSHNTDGLYSIKKTALVRASDDFYPLKPATHTTHIAAVAYNSIFLGEFMHTDWDTFQSAHPAGEYHAAARAIGGSPVYVSDKPGCHDFNVIRKLVLPDGSVLRAQLPGRPTRDCLFIDPARDGKSLLKIWNLNELTGVVGVFNCQGSGWCKVDKKYMTHDSTPEAASGSVGARDVDSIQNVAPEKWNGDCAVYSHRGGELVCLPKGATLPITLNVLEYEIFTISPVKTLSTGSYFAPIGLLQMFNSGAAILDFAVESSVETALNMIRLKVHGCGEFGAYSSVKPQDCLVNTVHSTFSYDPLIGLLKVLLPGIEGFSQDIVFRVSREDKA
ncbi:hypothetical protein GOP47_0007547 [Adiantum capillus-veneris]|uniref:galactinol--sucrose galactosyltransferase n=1 Tax=Adiantum capillus-veneris TaxID=13818 RepID=A0A9D4ZJB7_ADICA|nr:hypothetical protein GOP47_0007547 [Adiantum capillus-veneris]